MSIDLRSEAASRGPIQKGGNVRVASCLLEAATGKLIALDHTAADWLGIDREQNLHVSDLFPGKLARTAFRACLEEPNGPAAPPGEPIRLARADAALPELSVRFQKMIEFASHPQPTTGRAAWPAGPGPCGLVLAILQLGQASDADFSSDPLTGLPDRTALAEANHLARAGTYAVLFADLNGFKKINDTWGHACGDRVLQEVARRWQQTVRSGDLVVRYGGDEFVFLLPRISIAAATRPIIKRLQQATAEPIQVGDQTIEISMAIGAALGREGGASLEELIHEADRAMYASKRLPR